MSEAAIRERAQAFQALGDLANALAPVGCAVGVHSFLPRIAEQVCRHSLHTGQILTIN